VLDQAKSRALPVLTRIPDVTPAAQACCGVCRSCATTNIATLAAAGLAAAGLYVARIVRRIGLRA
jgi:hypothetical protein